MATHSSSLDVVLSEHRKEARGSSPRQAFGEKTTVPQATAPVYAFANRWKVIIITVHAPYCPFQIGDSTFPKFLE